MDTIVDFLDQTAYNRFRCCLQSNFSFLFFFLLSVKILDAYRNCRKWGKSAIVYCFRHGWTTLTYCCQYKLNGNVQKWRKSKVHEHVMMMIQNMWTISCLFLIFRVINYYVCECVCVCVCGYLFWLNVILNECEWFVNAETNRFDASHLSNNLFRTEFGVITILLSFRHCCLSKHRCKGNIEHLKTISN